MGAFPFFEILPSPVRKMSRRRYLRRYLRKRGREHGFPTRSSYQPLLPFPVLLPSDVLAHLLQQYHPAAITVRTDIRTALDQYLCKGKARASQGYKLTSCPVSTPAHRTCRSSMLPWGKAGHTLQSRKKKPRIIIDPTPARAPFYISPSG